MKITAEDIAMLVKITDELKKASSTARGTGDVRVAGKRLKLRSQLKLYITKLNLRQQELANERDNAILEKPFA
jgi:hypothetical protein